MCDQQSSYGDSQSSSRGHDGRGRGRGRGRRRGRGRGRGLDVSEELLPSTSAGRRGQGRRRGRGGQTQEQPLELVQVRPERAVTMRSLNSIPTEVRKEFVGRKRQATMQRILIPDAPPRKRQTRRPSPEREPCHLMMVEAPQQSSDPTNKNFESVVTQWILDEDSDNDLDIDLDNNLDIDTFPLPVMRYAATESACTTDMTELQTVVLQIEDALNDQVIRDVVPSDDYYIFDWRKDKTNFTGRRETFTGSSGPTFEVTDDMTPRDIFYKFFDCEFIDRLCSETNRYAEQKIASLRAENKLLPSSGLHQWTPTDRDEMVTFLAVIILQGLYPQPEGNYFSFNGFGTMPYFARIMSYNRFLLLKSFYHFVDNETLTDRTKLCKIRPLIDHLNNKFSTLYLPSQEIAIDESFLKWHGRLSFAQKIATKAAQVGVKTYELYESHTGYLWKFFVYVGKNTDTAPTVSMAVRPDDEMADRPDIDRPVGGISRPTRATAKIVYDLVEPLLHRGHTLIMDNFYNSPLLLRCLKRQQTDCYGTLRLNREFLPDSIKTLTKTDLRQGEVVATYSSDLSVMVWRDINLVSMISTYHHLQVRAQNKYNRLTYKPHIVIDYNKSMGGVDRKHQFLSAQPVDRRRNRIWYKKVFCRLLNTAVFNAFIIFQTKNPKVTYRNFRTVLAEDLLKHHRQIDLMREPRLLTNRSGQMTIRTSNRPTIVDDDHFPARSEAKKGRCWMCTRRKRDTRTTWKCIQCNVNLCIEHCFREYHKPSH